MVTILNKCSQRRDLVTCASAFAKAGLVQQLCAILRRINLCNILKQKTTKEKIEMITELSLIYHVKKNYRFKRTCNDVIGIGRRKQQKLEVHGRARREAARRRKSECKVILLSQNSSRSNDSWRMSPKSTKYSAAVIGRRSGQRSDQ